MAEREEGRREAVREQVRRFLEPTGEESVLDSGTGTGAFAFAVAPLVREVTALEVVSELAAEARARAAAFDNVTVVEGDAMQLPFPDCAFDIAATVRVLHHVPRPELVVAELARVARLGGRVLIVDQIAPIDPLLAFELDRFERARDPSHTRLLPDADLRSLLDANGLVLLRSEQVAEERDLDDYLDLAGCTGPERDQAVRIAPRHVGATVGWYLSLRPLPR